MLSQTARQEILRKVSSAVGYTISEDKLTPFTRQAITNLAVIQRHLFVITEILRGERSRVDRSLVLTTASKLGRDGGKAERTSLADEIAELQRDVDNKVLELSSHILGELSAHQSGQPHPEYDSRVGLVQLKCLACGASLPIPTSRYLQCQYCKATLTIQDVSAQLGAMIRRL